MSKEVNSATQGILYEQMLQERDARIGELEAEVDSRAAVFKTENEWRRRLETEVEGWKLKEQAQEIAQEVLTEDIFTLRAENERLLKSNIEWTGGVIEERNTLRARLEGAVLTAESYTEPMWVDSINDVANAILAKLKGEE